ncbi:hypothetical protein Ahy_A08g041108 isoform A [Arachis hypogaea]|uniref:Peptidase A1 domain-containing protein n=1 Tax=Arachis hypogaea TaxID=3818 RepID=A0A445C1P3_ARAHY|nr:hypothetical protein Ahy_A08g041108 isoform A [Arachis hypogaea]
MEEKKAKAKAFLLFFFFSVFITLSTATKETQTLILHPLPSQPTLYWPELETDQPDPEPESASLSVSLHHIDALSSNKTPHELFTQRLQRDAARVKINQTGFGSQPGSSFSSSVISGLAQGSGEYFTRLGVGTPPRYLYMVLDTGSDVVWLQCAPCKKCYSESDPVFDPKGSRTFAPVPCGSPLCRQLDSPGCDARKKVCEYQVSYGDGSFTVGDFATETLTFRRRASVPRVALGCGHDNEGLFVGAAGLLGLGRGMLSFPTQADSGTSVTRLTRPAYEALRDAFQVGAARLKRAPEYSLFDTCFDFSGMTQVKVPTVVLHFRGADVSLPAGNYLIPVDDKGTYCFAFAGTMSGLSIIGNIQQQGFRVVFDLAGSRVGFAPRGCA